MAMMGGGFWFPKTPTQYIAATVSTPTLSPVGGLGATVFKSITKTGGSSILKAAVAGGAAGLLGASLLGGGGSQEVKPTQTVGDVTPTQDLRTRFETRTTQAIRDLFQRAEAKAEAKAAAEVTVSPDILPTYNVTAGRDVDIGGVSHITDTTTISHAGVSQETVGQLSAALLASAQTPQQITIVAPEQKTEATKMDMGIIALIAVAGIALLTFMKGGKK